MSTANPTLHELSCADDYDPNSMPVPKAREVIARFLSPIGTIERVSVRAALGRVLSAEEWCGARSSLHVGYLPPPPPDGKRGVRGMKVAGAHYRYT